MARPKTVILGDRVRRVAHAGSPTIQRFLNSLLEQGISFVPRPLYLGAGFEELTYMQGVCFQPNEPRRALNWELDIIEMLGSKLRIVHDGSTGFLQDSQRSPWFPFAETCSEPEVICHCDLGPWNVPITDDGSISFIDWEMAAPGLRIWDLAQVAWNWVPLYPPGERERLGFVQCDIVGRMRALLSGYGSSEWSVNDICREAQNRQLRAIELVDTANSSADELLENWRAVNRDVIREDYEFTREVIKSSF